MNKNKLVGWLLLAPFIILAAGVAGYLGVSLALCDMKLFVAVLSVPIITFMAVIGLVKLMEEK